ncbi:hypothetical protein GIB67_006275 [Kingdonia uniflora]|uniref:beta-galactosidase n=1 Tax=Kingdonia uniflora TaxID=39325 RepID=A0A7J7P5M3_9MAGN|nr:hypothetical protein GIB67_006275 [Kingdonia uniflora]
MGIIKPNKSWDIFLNCSWGEEYHGGTNYGRTTGGPFITTTYDYDAPLGEYGEKDELLYLSQNDCVDWFLVHSKESKHMYFLQRMEVVQRSSRTIAQESAAKVVYNNKHYDEDISSLKLLMGNL